MFAKINYFNASVANFNNNDISDEDGSSIMEKQDQRYKFLACVWQISDFLTL